MGRTYRESSLHAKTVRLGIVDGKIVRPKARSDTPRPWRLEYISRHWLETDPGPNWSRWKDYRTEAEAETVRGKMMRKLPRWAWRVVST
jgi:hypothetical protein